MRVCTKKCFRALQKIFYGGGKTVGFSPNLYAEQGNDRVLSEENIDFKRSVFSVLSGQNMTKNYSPNFRFPIQDSRYCCERAV